MNILQILPGLKVGGVETGTGDLAKRLVKDGHKAVVVSSGGELVKELESFGAKHYTLPVDQKSLLTALPCIKKLAKIINDEKIDIVHARSRVPAIIAYFACWKTGADFITTCHGYYSKHLFSKVMGWGKYVIAISNAIARHMNEDFDTPMERIKLVPRGTDLDKFDFKLPATRAKGAYTIGVIARLTPIKGHPDFIKAVSQLVRQFPFLKVWIVGGASPNKKEYQQEIMTLVRRLGLSQVVEFLGTRKDIPQVLSKLDLLVLPTITQEAFGRVIVEAYAAGVPVVATKVGGIVDIVEDGRTGLLVPPGQPNMLAAACARLLKDRKLAQQFAQAARQKAEKEFSLDIMYKNTIDVYQKTLKTKRILVIKFSSPGDVVLSVPSVRAIRNKFPNAEITVAVGQKSSPVIQRCPYVDEVVVLDSKKGSGIKRIFELAGQLRKNNFDYVVDLQNNQKSHILAFLVFAPQRFGYDNGKLSFLLNKSIKDNHAPMPPVEHQFRVLKMLGIENQPQDLELWPSEFDREKIDSLLQDQWVSGEQVLVGINLGSSQKWLSKRWPLENSVKLADMLTKRMHARIVITGAKEDIPLAERFVSSSRIKPVNMVGKTSLLELAALIEKCSVYITSDSAPLHIASAMKVPYVALFGPTDPQRHCPPGAGFVLKKDLKCSPCYNSQCKTFDCMKKITVEEVEESVRKLLKR